MATVCDSVFFTQPEFDAGYIPANQNIVLGGLLSMTGGPDLPFPVQVSIDSQCNQVKFPDNVGGYVPNTVVTVNPNGVSYIPFRINAGGECGDFECELTYIFEIEDPDGNPIVCEGSAKIVAYVANCDFQDCLLKASEAYCNLDAECVTDLCADPCYQRFMRMVVIDDILTYKIAQKDWATVHELYDIALNQICNCDCFGNVIPKANVEQNNITEQV